MHIMIITGGTVGLAKGIIDDTYRYVLYESNIANDFHCFEKFCYRLLGRTKKSWSIHYFLFLIGSDVTSQCHKNNAFLV